MQNRTKATRVIKLKTVSRDHLVREARQAMRELVQQMRNRICDHPEAEQLMQELALQLETVKGKKSYGYLPKKQKAQDASSSEQWNTTA